MFLLTLSTGRKLRCTRLIGIFTLVVLGLACNLWGQDVEDLKSGVVKITARVEGKTQVGTGFIVRLERGAAYIVTAAHVIEGDPKPQVAFHPHANEFLPAQTLGIEGGDPRGVALLIVKGGIPSETRSFSIATKAAVRGGESVTVIGFPGLAGTPWMVTIGTIGGRKGGDLTFSGVVGEGNSGGPLLLNGKVIGVITQMGTKVSYAIPIASARFAIEGWGVELTESDEALLPKEVTGEDGITMVLVPGGEFLMGKEKQQVYLDAFYIDKTLAKESKWHESEKYCRDHAKRLPSEAEWEKAARRPFITISGKVDEWTADWYQENYPEIRALRNPKGPSIGESNDEELEKFDNQARIEAEREADSLCPGCSASERGRVVEFGLEVARDRRPARDMKKVVRKDLDSRQGVFSQSESIAFRCARDPT